MLCTRAIWLEKGEIKASGSPDKVIPAYQSFLDRLDSNSAAKTDDADIALPEKTATPAEPADTFERLDNATSENESTESDTPTDEQPAAALAKSGSGARLTRITATADGKSGKC